MHKALISKILSTEEKKYVYWKNLSVVSYDKKGRPKFAPAYTDVLLSNGLRCETSFLA
jgi:hypothetical protein